MFNYFCSNQIKSFMSLYSRRGVSAQKEEVHAATRNLDHGLYPNAFCRIYPDILGGEEDYVNVMHGDGAGTKSILAYLYWKETGDISVWKGIAQDAIVMNLDDLLCVGIYDNILFSSTIDRNKQLIPGEVLKTIIEGSQEFFTQMKQFGISISYLGGETADVGDVVRTIAVNGTMTARWPKSRLITNEKIQAGNIIVGLAGFGHCDYEPAYNSGLGSNGLTSARHDVLDKSYAENFPETFDPTLDKEVVYLGRHKMKEKKGVGSEEIEIGKMLLSPTRTFAPVIKEVLEKYFEDIHGLIHCSGGGQTKCLKFLPEGVRVVKDNLFAPPPVFDLIQEASGADDREMYQVFNMGTRMEIYTTEKQAKNIIAIAGGYGVEARIIGRVDSAPGRSLLIKTTQNELVF